MSVPAPEFPAKREAIRLLAGLAGGTGSGKTYSALRVAKGIAGEEPFAVIDTEHGRAKMYADDFTFAHYAFEPPFSPARYLEHIRAADAAGYPVVVVDSASHEHAGEGGILDMADAELERMGGRDSAKMASWIKPKAEHKAFVRELLRMRAHVILCLRAEPKIEMRKDSSGRWEVVPKPTLTGLDGWVPIAEKNLPFELTCSFLLMPDAPGIPKPIKLPERLRGFVPLDAPLAEQTGAALAAWAKGDEAPAPSGGHSPPTAANASPREAPELLTDDQRGALDSLFAPLRKAGELTTEILWAEIAKGRDEDVDAMIWRLDGRVTEEAGVRLAWSPLRDSLTKAEASALIDRLAAFTERLTAAGRVPA